MKISFSVNVDQADADSGKHRFLIRLSNEFKKRGIEIVKKNADVNIFLPCEDVDKNAKIKVLRLDGLIFNSKWDYEGINKKICKSINQSDAIVYQGLFCQYTYQSFLKIDKRQQ
jgi:hypothetical protein